MALANFGVHRKGEMIFEKVRGAFVARFESWGAGGASNRFRYLPFSAVRGPSFLAKSRRHSDDVVAKTILFFSISIFGQLPK